MKAVSEIVSTTLIVAISLILVSIALLYIYPMIRKNQDRSTLEKVILLFTPQLPNSIVKKLEYISNFGGAESISLDVNGIWEVRSYLDASPFSNSISFSFFSRVTNVNSNTLISLTPGETCPPQEGLIGSRSPFVVCVAGSPIFDGFNITYYVFARNLTSGERTYYIRFVTPTGEGLIRGNLKRIRIMRESLDSIEEGTKKVIIVNLKVEV